MNGTITLTREQGNALRWPVATLTPEQRDAVYELASAEFATLGELVYDIDQDNAWEVIQYITGFVHLFDALGWEEHGERETYELEINFDTAIALRDVDWRARREIKECRVDLHGRPGYIWSNEERAEFAETAPARIDQLLDVLKATELVGAGSK